MDVFYRDNPMNRGFLDNIRGSDKKVFDEGIKLMIQSYDKLLKEVDGVKYLPKGTILYQGSLNYPFQPGSVSTGDKNAITFLGLDIDISMWYIYELIMNKQFTLKDFKRYGFLYAFKLLEDLPITHVIDKLYLNPKEQKKCKETDSTCLHPQVSFRGSDFNYVVGSKLHTELTLNYNSYEDSFEIIRVYIVDGLHLHVNHGYTDYNVREAILQEYSSGTEYESPISYIDYSEMFMGEIYYCDNCGFSGNFQDVIEHEKTCSKKSGYKKKKRKKRSSKKKKKSNRSSKRKKSGRSSKKKKKSKRKKFRRK